MWLDEVERERYMLASIQATLYNAHFDTGGIQYTPEDILGTGDRQQRKTRQIRDKLESRSFQKSMSGPIDEENLPEWARARESDKVKN